MLDVSKALCTLGNMSAVVKLKIASRKDVFHPCLDIDQLCSQSIGAIIGDSAMTWVKADHARDAILEIEIAQADIARLPLFSTQ